jgi:hypothetical protein
MGEKGIVRQTPRLECFHFKANDQLLEERHYCSGSLNPYFINVAPLVGTIYYGPETVKISYIYQGVTCANSNRSKPVESFLLRLSDKIYNGSSENFEHY